MKILSTQNVTIFTQFLDHFSLRLGKSIKNNDKLLLRVLTRSKFWSIEILDENLEHYDYPKKYYIHKKKKKTYHCNHLIIVI